VYDGSFVPAVAADFVPSETSPCPDANCPVIPYTFNTGRTDSLAAVPVRAAYPLIRTAVISASG